VFEDIGVVAGVKGVTIIHGCSCAGGEVYLLRRLRCSAACRAVLMSKMSGEG
jgi:hypothetical protein